MGNMKVHKSNWFITTLKSPFFYIFLPLVWMAMMTFIIKEIAFEMFEIADQLNRIESMLQEIK